MRILQARNVNGLYRAGLDLLKHEGVREDTRNGPALVAPWPVTSVYERPTERVLFDTARDANPFFHLMEGLWMLAGRNDAAFLDRYVKDFGSRYAESDGKLHGAYGHRWRHALGYDQLDVIVQKLRANPADRQCVLQMWDAADHNDAWSGGIDGHRISSPDDLNGVWKDRPCNTHVYFRVRKRDPKELGIDVNNPNLDGSDYHLMNALDDNPVLDMTILCRSNDIVWGAYGANAVHMSMLMEYMAGRIGVRVGTMYQVSNNYHGYVSSLREPANEICDLYEDTVVPTPMGEDWGAWDDDLVHFMSWHDQQWVAPSSHVPEFTNSWFLGVAVHVVEVNRLWKQGARGAALGHVEDIEAFDWHQACRAWLIRRNK